MLMLMIIIIVTLMPKCCLIYSFNSILSDRAKRIYELARF